MFLKLLAIWGVTISVIWLIRKGLIFLQAKSDPFDQLRVLYKKQICPGRDSMEKVFEYERAMKLHRDQNKRLGDSKQKDVYLKIYEQILLNVEVMNTYILHYNEEDDLIKIREQERTIGRLMEQLNTLDNLYLELDAKATLGDPREIDDLIESLKEMAEV